ncbi:hypothetical protein BGZ79_002674 [Entomortierella chlamydospora]|nr:hypothetical protein BGZ79_002674 [Entomortierella chlamydospora]
MTGILPRALAFIFKSIQTHVHDSGEAEYRPIGYQGVEAINNTVQETQSPIEILRSQDNDLAKFAEKLEITLDDINMNRLLRLGNTDMENYVVPLPDGMDFSVWVSYAEIHKEKIYDLLAEFPKSPVPILGAMDPKRPTLDLRTDPSTKHKYIHGLREIRVRTLEEALLVVRAGLRQRQVFGELLSKTSCKSHCIFTIKILKAPQFGISAAETAAMGKTSVSRMSIVDLAGSERIQSTPDSDQRKKGAGNISLMYLSHCMEILRLNQKRSKKDRQSVPYQNSKLTQLYQSVLDGQSKNSRVCLIVNANPFESGFDETTKALRFSSTPVSVSTIYQANKKGDNKGVPKTSSPGNGKRLSPALNSTSHTPLQVRSIDRNPLSLEEEISTLKLQNQVLHSHIEDLYEQLEASENYNDQIETEERSGFMMDLMKKILSAFTRTETHTRSTSPIAFEAMDIDNKEENVQEEAIPALSEHAHQHDDEDEKTKESGDTELERLGRALQESEEKRVHLEQELDSANKALAAWIAWLGNAPSSDFRNPSTYSGNATLEKSPSSENTNVMPPLDDAIADSDFNLGSESNLAAAGSLSDEHSIDNSPSPEPADNQLDEHIAVTAPNLENINNQSNESAYDSTPSLGSMDIQLNEHTDGHAPCYEPKDEHRTPIPEHAKSEPTTDNISSSKPIEYQQEAKDELTIENQDRNTIPITSPSTPDPELSTSLSARSGHRRSFPLVAVLIPAFDPRRRSSRAYSVPLERHHRDEEEFVRSSSRPRSKRMRFMEPKPLSEESGPVVERPEPAVEESKLVIEDAVSVTERPETVVEKPMTLVEETMLLIEEPATVTEEATLVAEHIVSVVEEATSLSEKAEPVVKEATPIAERIVPVVEEATLVAEKAVLATEEAAPVVEEAALVVEEIVPMAEKPVLVTEEATLMVEGPTAGAEEALPAAKEAASLDDGDDGGYNDVYFKREDSVANDLPQTAERDFSWSPSPIADYEDANDFLSEMGDSMECSEEEKTSADASNTTPVWMPPKEEYEQPRIHANQVDSSEDGNNPFVHRGSGLTPPPSLFSKIPFLFSKRLIDRYDDKTIDETVENNTIGRRSDCFEDANADDEGRGVGEGGLFMNNEGRRESPVLDPSLSPNIFGTPPNIEEENGHDIKDEEYDVDKADFPETPRKRKRKLRAKKAIFEEEMEETIGMLPPTPAKRGWYESQPDSESDVAPCIFTSVTPAWNNMNLIRLADKIKSPLVFAHVRPSTAGSVSESNCHPWQYGRLMFMHHGMINDFYLIKRKVQESLSDDLYLSVNGNTDSEWAFAVFLSQLESPRQAEPFSHTELQEAMLKTIRKLNAWCNEARIANHINDSVNVEASMLNFAVSDGASIVCTRYVNSSKLEPVSLYFSSGSKFECDKPGHYRMVKESAKREDIVVIASEPLTFEEAEWREIPRNSMAVITARMNVLIYPIVDENSRSSGVTKAPEKAAEEAAGTEDTAVVVNLKKTAEIHGGERRLGDEGEDVREPKKLPEAIFINTEKQRRNPSRPGVSSNDGNHLESGYSMASSMSSYPSSSFIPSSPSSASSLSTELSHLNEDITTVMDGYVKSDSLLVGRRDSESEHFRIVGCDGDDNDDASEIEEDYRIFPAKSSLSAARLMISKKTATTATSSRSSRSLF